MSRIAGPEQNAEARNRGARNSRVPERPRRGARIDEGGDSVDPHRGRDGKEQQRHHETMIVGTVVVAGEQEVQHDHQVEDQIQVEDEHIPSEQRGG